MMKSRRIFCLLLWFNASASLLQAQPVYVQSAESVDFPNVRVVIHDRNPTLKEVADFKLTEAGKQLSFKLTALPKAAGSDTTDVLILLEYQPWPEAQEQNQYFLNLLKRNAAALAGGKRYFRLAIFDWTQANGTVLQWVQKEATNKTERLISAVNSLALPQPSARAHHASEIYQALDEAFGFMSSRNNKSIPAVFILSAEFSNIYNDKYDDAELISKGRRKDIPLYAMRYPRMSEKYSLSRIADETYGLHAMVLPDDAASGDSTVQRLLRAITPRSKGRNYQFEFTTSAAADGAYHQADLIVTGTESAGIRFKAPGILYLMNKHPWIWALLFLLVAAVFWGLWLLFKRLRRQRKETLDRVERVKLETEKAIELQQTRWAEEQVKQEAASRALEEQQRYQERNRLLHALARQPRLIDVSGNTILVTESEFTIGRDAHCTLKLDDAGISRKHAMISFASSPGMSQQMVAGKFFLIDLNSSNGTSLNGARLSAPHQGHPLKNGDVIGIGRILFTFQS